MTPEKMFDFQRKNGNRKPARLENICVTVALFSYVFQMNYVSSFQIILHEQVFHLGEL